MKIFYDDRQLVRELLESRAVLVKENEELKARNEKMFVVLDSMSRKIDTLFDVNTGLADTLRKHLHQQAQHPRLQIPHRIAEQIDWERLGMADKE